jgi:hypothetical protein
MRDGGEKKRARYSAEHRRDCADHAVRMSDMRLDHHVKTMKRQASARRVLLRAGVPLTSKSLADLSGVPRRTIQRWLGAWLLSGDVVRRGDLGGFYYEVR